MEIRAVLLLRGDPINAYYAGLNSFAQMPKESRPGLCHGCIFCESPGL